MDVTGLLASMLAVAVYPGGLYLLIAAVLHRAAAGWGAGPRPAGSLASAPLVPMVAAVAGAAMLPLTASPGLHLPSSSGVDGNVVAVVTALGVAVACSSLPASAAQLGALAAAAVLALAASSRSLSVLTIAAGGAAPPAARFLIAVTLVIAASLPPPSASSTGSAVRATLGLAAASLTVPAALGGAPPVVGALAALAVVVVTAAAGRVLGALRLPPRYPLAAGALTAVTATALALLGGRA